MMAFFLSRNALCKLHGDDRLLPAPLSSESICTQDTLLLLDQETYYGASCFDYHVDDILITLIYSASFNLLKNSKRLAWNPLIYTRRTGGVDEEVVEDRRIHLADRIHYKPPVSPSVRSWWSLPATDLLEMINFSDTQNPANSLDVFISHMLYIYPTLSDLLVWELLSASSVSLQSRLAFA